MSKNKQALAIAYATKRHARKMSKGGMVQDQHDKGTERDIEDGMIPYKQSGHQYSSSRKPMNDENKAFGPTREDQYQHDKDMREAAHRDGLVSFADGGMVDETDENMHDMAGNPERFLSDEMRDTPFHSFDYNESESSGLFDDDSMDNTEGNADQNEARKGIMDRIMRKVRMRNMGR